MNPPLTKTAVGLTSTSTLRVLLADDSYFVQKYMKEWLEAEGDIEVVAAVSDGLEAVRQVMQVRPNLIFLDVRMPKLDGLGALRQIMRSYPTPTVIFMDHEANPERDERIRQKAMELGALDVLFKPTGDEMLEEDAAERGADLRTRVRTLSKIKVVRLLQKAHYETDTDNPVLTPPPGAMMREASAKGSHAAREMVEFALRSDAEVQGLSADKRIVLIGASTGGPDAIRVVLSRLPATFPYPVVVAMHMPKGFTGDFARQLEQVTSLKVVEASERDVLRPGHVYIAPGNQDIELRGQSGFTLTQAEDTGRHSPNIDLLFKSGAARFAAGTLGVVLTGMGVDGQAGVRTIQACGGKVIAQDEKTSSIFGMPAAAVETGCVDVVAPVEDIAQWIVDLACRQEKGASV